MKCYSIKKYLRTGALAGVTDDGPCFGLSVSDAHFTPTPDRFQFCSENHRSAQDDGNLCNLCILKVFDRN